MPLRLGHDYLKSITSLGAPTGGIFRHEAHQTNVAWIRESESLRGNRLQPQDSATLGMAQSCTTDVNPSFAIDMPGLWTCFLMYRIERHQHDF